jgi:hypothetical protein
LRQGRRRRPRSASRSIYDGEPEDDADRVAADPCDDSDVAGPWKRGRDERAEAERDGAGEPAAPG